MSMEEEEYERCSVPNNHVTPVSRNWQSAKSRVSVESLQSIGPRRLEQSFGDTHKENQKYAVLNLGSVSSQICPPNWQTASSKTFSIT